MKLALILAALPVVLSVWATLLVMRDAFSERGQKVAQLLLVWFLPVIGAFVVFAIYRRPEPPSGQHRVPADAGDDYAVSGRELKGFRDAIDGDE